MSRRYWSRNIQRIGDIVQWIARTNWTIKSLSFCYTVLSLTRVWFYMWSPVPTPMYSLWSSSLSSMSVDWEKQDTLWSVEGKHIGCGIVSNSQCWYSSENQTTFTDTMFYSLYLSTRWHTHTNTHARTYTHARARTHARTRTHTHTHRKQSQLYVSLFLFWNMWVEILWSELYNLIMDHHTCTSNPSRCGMTIKYHTYGVLSS